MKIFKTITIVCIILICFTKTCYNINYSRKNIIDNYQITEDKNIPTISIVSKKREIDENTGNIINNYYNLKELIKEAYVKIPIFDKFIPQGITLVGSNYLITGYYDSHKNSTCYVLNALGEIINVVELDTNSHVGSISYDEKRNLLWLPDNNGILNAYDALDFFTKKAVNAIHKFDYVSEGLKDFQNTEKNLIAYLCVDDDYVYIGNFFKEYECTVKKYQIINTGGGISLKYVNKFKVPKRTQSIAFTSFKKRKYMLLSQSYGRNKPSYLYIYEYDESKDSYNGTELKKIKAPSMLEQISISNTLVYLLFESNASKYWNSSEKIEFVISLNLLDLLNENGFD